MAMAKDGEIPSFFAFVHPKFHTPWESLSDGSFWGFYIILLSKKENK